MFKSELLLDRAAAAKQQRSRNREAERQERIFNDKHRTIGIDKEALDMQVKEKKKQEEVEKKEQKAHDAEALHHSRVAYLLQNRQHKQKRSMEKDTVSYRQQYQQPWCRREYDLNDPERCKKTSPADAQMMPPGLVGEDPHCKDRVQRQRVQLRGWLIQQQNEQATERQRQRLEEQQYNQYRLDMDNHAVQLQSIEMERRKAAAVATKDYNLAMIQEKHRQESEHRNDESDTDSGDKPAQSMMGAPGLCPSSDRRPPPETPQQIAEFHKRQMEEKKRTAVNKNNEEERYDRVRIHSARTALLIERQQAKLNKQLQRQLDSTNLKLAETHKQLTPDIARGRIDESFFSKFNTSSR
ncbi:RIB43A-like with coiled-coils protein 2 [Sphaeramia orbicularis]|uniref:RIB43A-like with coiled-coils protein 2 n=1 Tax=Sphaeramia orbicularis TaxID=375764 RepID=UPI00117E6801|nr:RIB43A-like with coiled-coils protein 2 [Sphaeramia orbicularis]